MPAENFFTDNPDLQFHINQGIDWKAILDMKQTLQDPNCAFSTIEEAVSTFSEMMADPIGDLAANRIAPRAWDVDNIGCQLVDGKVLFPEGLQRNLKELNEAQLMGLTIPTRFGGLNFPEVFYAAAIEVISRADASLMNFFGLQGGIGATINQFGSDALKEKYLPGMAAGDLTGAMALTEADAGSDLAAVQTRAGMEANYDPVTDTWKISGTKRFITNGCGDVILVLARSEDPDKYGGGRGLSFFLVEKSEKVIVRRIEHKLGIHGSPTCELYFDNAPGYLIGKRGFGLARYTSWLMLAARLAVAAQAQGISEAALKAAEKYADEREQFGKPIRQFAQVAAMLQDMRVYSEASRALLYATSAIVDLHQGAEHRELKDDVRKYGKLADTLTPMAKYYATELSNKIAYQSIQIHGGNGFMREYAVERLYRDARITNIYEGTSQIQVNWAMLRVLKGTLDDWFAELAAKDYGPALAGQAEAARANLETFKQACAFLQEKDNAFREWTAPFLVDLTIDVLVSFLFLGHATQWDAKVAVADKFIRDAGPRIRMNLEYIRTAKPTVSA